VKSTRLVNLLISRLSEVSKLTKPSNRPVRLKSRSHAQTERANQLELSYASIGRIKQTSGETLTWLELTRQQGLILD
jgi:hypothetical protein